jgi:hypothetical protein
MCGRTVHPLHPSQVRLRAARPLLGRSAHADGQALFATIGKEGILK